MAPPQTQPVDVEALAGIRVFAGPDQPLLIGQLWQRQPVILIFLRHFACISCRAHAAQIWRDREKFEDAGAKIVFIGNGQPHWIEVFRLELALQQALILTDPTLESFRIAGLKKGLFYLLRPRSAVGMTKLARAGFAQGKVDADCGSHVQMGGILAISPEGRLVYRFVSEAVGDLPEEPYLELIWRDEKLI